LLGYVTGMVGGDRYAAEDIVQESLLRAWQYGDRLRPEQARAWLFTVAHNLVVSRYRRRKHRAAEVTLDQGQDLPATHDDLALAVEKWQMLEAMRALSADHRRVLFELYYLRRSVAEAAEALSVPQGTVKSRAYYALRALRDVLEERGVVSR
jgi:RNA polymerase sigma-70 factor (ECF subfamily)